MLSSHICKTPVVMLMTIYIYYICIRNYVDTYLVCENMYVWALEVYPVGKLTYVVRRLYESTLFSYFIFKLHFLVKKKKKKNSNKNSIKCI